MADNKKYDTFWVECVTMYDGKADANEMEGVRCPSFLGHAGSCTENSDRFYIVYVTQDQQLKKISSKNNGNKFKLKVSK